MGTDELRPTNEGLKLVREWMDACVQLKRTAKRAEDARVLASRMRDRIGRWLVPEDAEDGSQYVLPIGRSFLVVHVSRARDIPAADEAIPGPSSAASFVLLWGKNGPPDAGYLNE